MKKYKFLLFIMIVKLTLVNHSIARSKEIELNLCSDENPQFPALFQEGQEVNGLYADIMKEVVKELKSKLDIHLKFNFMPWNRCLEELKLGRMDAALTASYKPDRAKFLNYPEGSSDEKSACSSLFKIYCNEHLVVTMKKSNIIYDGNPKNLPIPVRATRGYSVVTDLEKEGVIVDISKGETNGIKQLIRDETGCVIVTGMIAHDIVLQNQYKNILQIQEKPFIQKSYYMPFSKRSPISHEEQQWIWDKISKISNNQQKIHALYHKYTIHN